MFNPKRALHTLWELKAFALIIQATVSGMWAVGTSLNEDIHEVKKATCANKPNGVTGLECLKKVFSNYTPDGPNGYRVIGIAHQGTNNVSLLLGIFSPALIVSFLLVAYTIRFTYRRQWGTLAYAYAWIELKKDATYKLLVILAAIFAIIGIMCAFAMANTSGHPNAAVLNNMILSVFISLVVGLSDLWRTSVDIVQYNPADKNLKIDMFANGALTTSEQFKDNFEDAMLAFDISNGNDGRFAKFAVPEQNEVTAREMLTTIRGAFTVQAPVASTCFGLRKAEEKSLANDVEIERASGK